MGELLPSFNLSGEVVYVHVPNEDGLSSDTSQC